MPAVILLTLAAAGCGGTSPHTNATVSGPEATVRRYVEDLAHGKVGSAFALRCPGIAIGPAQRAEFTAQVRDQWSRLGTLEHVTTRLARDDGGDPHGLLSAPRAYVAFRIDTTRGDGPELRAVMVRDHGTWLYCGGGTALSAPLCESTPQQLGAGPTTDLTARSIIDVAPGPDLHLIEDRPVPDIEGSHFEAGWTRAWRHGTYGGERANAWQYATPTQAQTNDRGLIERDCADGAQSFTVPGVTGAVGMRLRAYAWLGIQPPDQGPYIDTVYFTRGATAVYLASSPLEAKDDHRRVTVLASLINKPTRLVA